MFIQTLEFSAKCKKNIGYGTAVFRRLINKRERIQLILANIWSGISIISSRFYKVPNY